jgi:ribosomal protein S18
VEKKTKVCPVCEDSEAGFDRRDFLKTVGVTAAVATAGLPLFATTKVQAAPSAKSAAETAVKGLFETLTDDQMKAMCFDWDYKDPKRGLLRTFVSNNWQITPHHITSDYYTKKQQAIIHDIFKGMINPDWYGKFVKQLKDDTGGKEWGAEQSIAIFGKPGDGNFEFVMTGRHMTLRADGHSNDKVAFGGPVFYGHAASGFNEKVHHPGNVFWHQAELANKVFDQLDDKQQKEALIEKRPKEAAVDFHGEKGAFPGIPIAELSDDQKKSLQKVLDALLEPYRTEDKDEALVCLKKQGGLDKCSLAFYEEGDIGNDREWDNWRIEGPSFVWYFRGEPHVHVWVNVANDPSVKLNAIG